MTESTRRAIRSTGSTRRRWTTKRILGRVGRFIGSPKNAPNNIAFVVVVLVLICGGIALALPTDRADIWKTLIPVVTLTLGYIFGKNSGKD